MFPPGKGSYSPLVRQSSSGEKQPEMAVGKLLCFVSIKTGEKMKANSKLVQFNRKKQNYLTLFRRDY